MRYLVAWVGRQDLEGMEHDPPRGPIVDFLRVHPDATAVLLCDWPRTDGVRYEAVLRRAVPNAVDLKRIKLPDPTDYLAIFRNADACLAELAATVPLQEIAIQTSPGTSPMAAVWVRWCRSSGGKVRRHLRPRPSPLTAEMAFFGLQSVKTTRTEAL